MKIWKFKKPIEIEKTIGHIHIETFNYGSAKNGKIKDWTELHCWYECDCEHCPASWADMTYEGECIDCGCLLAKKGYVDAPTRICMLPKWIKEILIKRKLKSEEIHDK